MASRSDRAGARLLSCFWLSAVASLLAFASCSVDGEYSFEPPEGAGEGGAAGERAAPPLGSAGEEVGGLAGSSSGGSAGAGGALGGSAGEPGDNGGGGAGAGVDWTDSGTTGGDGESPANETGGSTAVGGSSAKGGTSNTGGLSGAAGHSENSGSGGATAVTRCNPSAPFGDTELFLETGAADGGGRLSADELTLYFHSTGTDSGKAGIWSSTRSATDEPFGEARHLLRLDTGFDVASPSITADGLELYYATGTAEGSDTVLVSVRSNRVVAFESGSPVANVAGDYSVSTPFVLPDGSELFFTSNRDGGADLFHAYRQGGGFGTPSPLGPLNSDSHESAPVATEDGLTIYFSRRLSNDYDIYRATRRTRSASFGDPELVEELSTPGVHEFASWVSADDCIVHVDRPVSAGSTNWNILRANRPKE